MTAEAVRKALQHLNYTFVRETSSKHYTRFMIVLPLPRFAYVFRYRVTGPVEFLIDVYDTVPTHSGELHFIEIYDVVDSTIKHIKRFLRELLKYLPREPWNFDWRERLKTGIILPEYLFAKRTWRRMLGH